MPLTITVLGAGSLGTALAKLVAEQGHEVRPWSRRPEHAQAVQQSRTNERYLPGFLLPATLECTADLESALQGAFRGGLLSPRHARARRGVAA